MKKIAVFGKPGSGKSTLSKKIASATGIQLHPLDSIAYKKMAIRQTGKHTTGSMEIYSPLIVGLLMALGPLSHLISGLMWLIHLSI